MSYDQSRVCQGQRRCPAAARAGRHQQGPLLPGGVRRAGLHGRACLVWWLLHGAHPLTPAGLQVLGQDATSGVVWVCCSPLQGEARRCSSKNAV